MSFAICKHCRKLFDTTITPGRFGDGLLCSWHPGGLEHIGHTGSEGDYAEIYKWDCCGKTAIGPIVETRRAIEDRLPPQSPGCQQGPHEKDDRIALADDLADLFESLQLKLNVVQELENTGVHGNGVFVSYSHADKQFVDQLTQRFRADGIRFWRDEKDILVGDAIDRAISDGIQKHCLFLTVLTPSSIKSRWVRRELDEAAHEAADSGKVILPIVANGLTHEDIPPRLRRFKCADFGDLFEGAYSELLRSIRSHLARNANRRNKGEDRGS